MADSARSEPVRRSNRGGFFFLLFTCAAIYIGYALRASYDLVDVRSFHFKPRPELKGPLALNDRLEHVDRLLKNKILGPESIEVADGKLYTGVDGGKILEITDGEITDEYQLVEKCEGEKCGRILGIRHLKEKEFVVADPYRGLLVVNMREKSHRVVLPANAMIDGQPMRLADDLDILGEDVFLSDCSTRWTLHEFFNGMLELKATGRILKVNIRTGGVTVIAKDLYFPNGVQLFPDKKSLLTSETTTARVTRIHIAGEKAGQKEIFLDNLPCYPDNIRLSNDGKSFWVACYAARVGGKFSVIDAISDYPFIRRLILSLLDGRTFFSFFTVWQQQHAIALHVDQEGRILTSLHDPTAKVLLEITQVTEDKDYLYFGNFNGPFLGRLRK